MVKNDCNSKSAGRRPLRDVSNGVLKSTNNDNTTMKSNIDKQQFTNSDNQDPLDRLLLVHSDISSLLRQIDELVVEAVNVDTTDNDKIAEIKSFTTVLSEIHSSLEPWVPRLQKALTVSPTKSETQFCETSYGAYPVADQGDAHTVDTPELTKDELLVSPSPLVSWRATECAEEGGKQLFLLTPQVRASTATAKPHAPPKLTTYEGITSDPIAVSPSPWANDKSISKKVAVVSEYLVRNPGIEFFQKVSVEDVPTALITPCLKNPLKTCVLHEPDYDLSYRKLTKSHTSTPFPTGNGNVCKSADPESSSGEVSEKLGLKYPEIIGIKPSYMSKNRSRALDASPAWIMSPPKCCKLLEPLDEKQPKDNASFQELARTFNQQTCLVPPTESNNTYNNNNQDKENKKIPLQGKLRSNFAKVERTPLWKGSASTIHRGKRPGENTLKKELWTRFEAASMNECQLNFSAVKDTSTKGFLARLEEASCDVE